MSQEQAEGAGVVVGVQAPPNLTPLEQGDEEAPPSMESGWAALLAAGINDWGGLSPITRDFVNPEKPWPHITGLAAVTARGGFPLLPRCPCPARHPALSDSLPYATSGLHGPYTRLARQTAFPVRSADASVDFQDDLLPGMTRRETWRQTG